MQVTIVNKREFDGLRADRRGAPRRRRTSAPTGWASGSPAVVAAAAVPPSLTYVYDSDLDWTGHKFGVASTQWLQQLAMVDAEAEQLREALPASTRLLVVADHGMVDSPPEAAGRRRRASTCCATGSRLLGGEARFRHLYCSRGVGRGRGRHLARACWATGPTVLTRDEAVGARLVRHRRRRACCPGSATCVVACRGETAVVSSTDFAYEDTLVGLHGSLTSTEMLIPVLVG